MSSFLDSFDRQFARVLGFLIAVVAGSIGLIAILIPLNLLLVKMHWGSMWWLHESVEYALYVGVFLGAPWVLRQGAHVRVDVLIMALPPGAAKRLEQVMDIAGAVLCAALCFYGARMAVSEFTDGTMPDKDLRIPTGYMMIVFAVSFALLALEFVLRMRRSAPPQQAGSAAAEHGAGF
jgi:TRAP-type transport system small permease protein